MSVACTQDQLPQYRVLLSEGGQGHPPLPAGRHLRGLGLRVSRPCPQGLLPHQDLQGQGLAYPLPLHSPSLHIHPSYLDPPSPPFSLPPSLPPSPPPSLQGAERKNKDETRSVERRMQKVMKEQRGE